MEYVGDAESKMMLRDGAVEIDGILRRNRGQFETVVEEIPMILH